MLAFLGSKSQPNRIFAKLEKAAHSMINRRYLVYRPPSLSTSP